MSTQKFIIVSNRLPVSVAKVDGKLTFTPSTGGLATAMSSLEGDVKNSLWVGWPGIPAEELTAAEKAAVTRKLRSYGCFPVFLTQAQVSNFYGGYSNATLWPLFHYFQSTAVFNKNYWQAYKEVSAIFKKIVAKQAAPEATIWVHDYHLMLLPQLLRTALPKSTIGFFLHIPFPSFEIFRLLPDRKDILEGLLGADLVGFHTYDYVRHFTSSVLRTLGLTSSYGGIALKDRTVRADAFPIGIDYQKFTSGLKNPVVQEEMAVLDTHYRGQKIILSVDRLDYSKGIPERLAAYEQFLEQFPQYHKQAVLVMVAVPSRTEVEAYQDMRDHIEQTISRINGRFGTVDWTPISYQFQSLPFEQVLALYAKADVALVTPLRDGMNLVAKEYVAAKKGRHGVLILSELAGAIDELPESLSINPNNTELVAHAIKRALTMPKAEQKRRLRSMQKRLSHYDVQRWAADFMEELALSVAVRPENTYKDLSAEEAQKMVGSFRRAQQRAILLDYDGTLRGFVSSPEVRKAAPSKSLLALLKQLSHLPNTDVTIISGRPREALEKWFGALPINLVAEHGFWLKQHGEWAVREVAFKEWRQKLLPVLERYAERTPGAIIEEKTFSLVWHYRNVAPELAYARNASLKHELGNLLNGGDVGIFSGHKVIEIKPRGVNKGLAASELLAEKNADFIFCAGDDQTDEDMFEALGEDAYTVKIGPGNTAARFQVTSTKDVLDILQHFAKS